MGRSLRTVRWLAWPLCAALLIGCGAKAREVIPVPLAGQLAPDYRLGPLRGVVLARVTVSTQSAPGFGSISNPLIMEFRQQGSVAPDEMADFRARYPQFREIPVERRLARIVPSPQ